MEAFEPLINLLLLLSTLSIAAERLANAIKLGIRGLAAGKERERRVARVALAVSILLALAVKADFFEILRHLEAPWETLGWAGREREAPAGATIQMVLGMIVTGVALRFGSKFWHDLLDIVHDARRRLSS